MPSSRLVLGGLAALALLLAALQGVHTQMHTRVEVLTDTCDAELQYLWGNYTNPAVAPIAGCDRDCLAACQVTLDGAINSETQQNCPSQTDITRCLQVYSASWTSFVNKCALFKYGTSGGSGAEAEAEAEAGEATAAPTEAGEAEAEAEAGASPVAPSEAREAEAEAGALTVAPAEAGEAEAESEAGRRRVLLQDATAVNGCFPNFASAKDFTAYVNGEYKSTTSTAPTASTAPPPSYAAVGMTLSVLIFTCLLLAGTVLQQVWL